MTIRTAMIYCSIIGVIKPLLHWGYINPMLYVYMLLLWGYLNPVSQIFFMKKITTKIRLLLLLK